VLAAAHQALQGVYSAPLLALQTWECESTKSALAAHQSWSLGKDGTIRLGSSGSCVGTSDCNDMNLRPCDGGTDQRWNMTGPANATQIQQKTTGLCINAHIGPHGLAAALPLVMGQCAASDRSKWLLTHGADHATFACASAPALCFDHGSRPNSSQA